MAKSRGDLFRWGLAVSPLGHPSCLEPAGLSGLGLRRSVEAEAMQEGTAAAGGRENADIN